MTKRFTAEIVSEQILTGYGDTTYGAPWHLAPPALVDAVDNAEVAVPAAKEQWDAEGRTATRAGKPLPSRDPLDTAAFGLDNARDDLRLAQQRLRPPMAAVVALLNDPAVRDEWAARIAESLPDLREALTTAASNVEAVVRDLRTGVGMTYLLGDWRQYQHIPGSLSSDPSTSLREAAAIPVWTTPVPGQLNTIHA
jgi:hypothetical protein